MMEIPEESFNYKTKKKFLYILFSKKKTLLHYFVSLSHGPQSLFEIQTFV